MSPWHDPDCRCYICERKDRMFGHLGISLRLAGAAEYARDVVKAAPALDRAIEQARYAIETARQPTACGEVNSCHAVAKHMPGQRFKYACFGCPNRRVETPFLQRKDW